MSEPEGASQPDRISVPRRALASIPARIKSWSARALDAILPPQCPITGERVAEPGLVSAEGWSQLRFIDDPVCARCGAPFAYDDYGASAECAACMAAPPAFDRARAAVVYNEASHKLIVAFKHADRTELAPLFAGWLARAGAPLLRAGTIVAPTPLHPARLLGRRYNQAAILAADFAKGAGAPFFPDAVRRVRATAPQKRLSAEARKRNVAGAFAANPERTGAIAGARVILVDDVLTTGATLSAAARALKKAGAASVDALVLARVARGGIDAI